MPVIWVISSGYLARFEFLDYLGGPNHVLPTARSARFASGLSVYDFLKRITYLECNQQALQTIGKAAITLAQVEGLSAHAGSVSIRLQ
ncbi:hypothetical protein RIVM261_041430 [Rivularia sp. IAM M-261]|nr:hypothetical protein RIVM261_041430 [Rivularia sp. IAM M-261]